MVKQDQPSELAPKTYKLWEGREKPIYKENQLKEYSENAWGTTCVFNITGPTLTLYPAEEENTGAAVMIIPGGRLICPMVESKTL